ncbi:MAG: hypothetical protein J3K34DRAFT_519757 [Monoraphidium minutum]|nr:MAG: hypothetical protein J3K34DRAFT_519757 [Monoraphidium minutum]
MASEDGGAPRAPPGAAGAAARAGGGAGGAALAAPPPLTLDECRDAFYVSQRACERYARELQGFVDLLDSKKAAGGEAWIEAVQDAARKAAHFHGSQVEEWRAFAERSDAYVESVRRLAERMAIAELKGEALEDADLAENKARTVHPELLRFKLEKRARILGRMGGVPALGPGVVMPKLPSGGPALRATGSAAAREISYSKVEGKDARYLADVFQFKKGAKDGQGPAGAREEPEKSDWQQEASTMLRRRAQSEKTEEELRESLKSPFGDELTGVLQQRHSAQRQRDDEDAAAAASAFRRASSRGSSGGGGGGGAGGGGGGGAGGGGAASHDATPELAAKLRRRQEEEERAARDAAVKAKEAAAAAAAAAEDADDARPRGGAAAFGSELAATPAAAPPPPAGSGGSGGRGGGGGAPGGAPAFESELAARLRRMRERSSSGGGGGA